MESKLLNNGKKMIESFHQSAIEYSLSPVISEMEGAVESDLGTAILEETRKR